MSDSAARRRRCPGHARHWFAPDGHPGLRLPKCIRCGAPNPRPLTTDDWQELADDYFSNLKTWTGEPMIEDVAKMPSEPTRTPDAASGHGSDTKRSGLRLAYADPPYPGCASLYRDQPTYAGEVDHAELLARLDAEYDGWALSTNENALQPLLALAPRGVRVLAWCKTNAPPFFDHPIRSWEPVIIVPARTAKPPVPVRSFLATEAPTGFRRGDDLPGQKNPAFCEWVIRCLGAEPEDTLDDLFPGTGVMAETWARWRSSPELFRTLTTSARGRERVRAAQGPSLEESAA